MPPLKRAVFRSTLALVSLCLAPLFTACDVAPTARIDDRPIVDVVSGKLQGTRDEETRVAHFRGIPFAAPPVGDLRWAAPAPTPNWHGVRDANTFGAECMQIRSKGGGTFVRSMVAGMGYDNETRDQILEGLATTPAPAQSEDCLFLNIRTANLGVKTLQPVMVWIHGGSHTAGAGSRPSYQSNAFVDRGLVYVSINYRLGALGYMAHPALSADSPDGVSGNYGLLDQVAALQWVRDNIQAFGGDPKNVTIFGESAGSQSVAELMATPAAAGLFHKGILESGVTSGNFIRLKEAGLFGKSMEQGGSDFLVATGLASTDADAATLRNIPATDIIKAQPKARANGSVFLPVADGKVFPQTMGETIVAGNVLEIPTLAGYNSDEGSLFYLWMKGPIRESYKLPKDPAARVQALRDLYAADAETIIRAYGLGNEETRVQGEIDMLGDDMFGVHARLLAKEQSAHGLPTYFYLFSRTPPSPTQTNGAYHAAEIPFVFNIHTLTASDDPADAALTKAMGDYWANFAKTGNPNGEDLTAWETYDATRDNWLILDHETRMKDGPRKEKLDAQENFLRQQISTSGE